MFVLGAPTVGTMTIVRRTLVLMRNRGIRTVRPHNKVWFRSVKLLACSYDSCVTVGRGNLETPTAAVLQAIERLRQWWVIRMWKLRNCRRLFEPLPSA